jgi:hypothetical protein
VKCGQARTWRTALGALVLLAVLGPPAAAQDDDGEVSFTATVEDVDLARVDANDPLELRPDTDLRVDVEITNGTTDEVFIRAVRLDSRVMGLTFFTFTTRIDLRVDAGDTASRSFLVDLGDLGDQAVGLLPARLALLDENRSNVASMSFPVDVRGSLTSVYGLFGIIVAIITALLLAAAIARLATHRLPANRWSRAARFGVPGLGIGMTLTFTLSALRLLTPGASAWIVAVLVCGAIGCAVGWLSPDPRDDETDDEELIHQLLSEYHARQREAVGATSGAATGGAAPDGAAPEEAAPEEADPDEVAPAADRATVPSGDPPPAP